MTGDPDGVWQYLVGTRHDLTHTKNISIKHAVRGEFSKVLTSLGTVLHPPQIEFDMNITEAYFQHIFLFPLILTSLTSKDTNETH